MPQLPTSILIPTDFSATAEAAVRVGTAMASLADTALHLLHVRVLLADPHFDEEHHSRVEELLEETDERVVEALTALHDEDLPVEHRLVRGLSVTEAILESVQETSSDLIVMGTHGRRGLKHLVLGSVAEDVVRSSPVPVLTVRKDAVVPGDVPRRLMVGCDFSSACRSAVEWAGSWARAVDGSVTLVHAVEPMVYPEFYAVDIFPTDLMDRIDERSREAMEELAHRYLRGVVYTVDVLNGSPGKALVEAADPQRFDLLIVGNRGLSPFEEVLLGSVATKVVRTARLPVLTARAPADEDD